jgi:hypothetical protein
MLYPTELRGLLFCPLPCPQRTRPLGPPIPIHSHFDHFYPYSNWQLTTRQAH